MATDLPSVAGGDLCPVCDRLHCPRWEGTAVAYRAVEAVVECNAHAVNWRDRALAAEEKYRDLMDFLIDAIMGLPRGERRS